MEDQVFRDPSIKNQHLDEVGEHWRVILNDTLLPNVWAAQAGLEVERRRAAKRRAV